MEPQPALVGSDGIVELDPPGAVDPDVAFVVLPAHSKDHHPVGFSHALQDAGVLVGGVVDDLGHQGFDHFKDGLVKLSLAWIPAF